MTFIGYEETDIQNELKKLEKTAEDNKAGKLLPGKTYSIATEMFDDIKSRKDTGGNDPQDDDAANKEESGSCE